MEKNFEQLFAARYPQYEFLVRRMRLALNVDKVTFDDINSTNINIFRNYMAERVSANSLKTYMAVVKSFINSMADDGFTRQINFKNVGKVKTVPSENIALTEEEIERIEKYVPKTKSESDIKAQFLCEVYCLARSSDIKKMTDENIRDGYITYISQKTKISTSVPIHKNFLKYFHQRGREYSRTQYNRVMKRICKSVGICDEVKLFYHGALRSVPKYSLVGSHTARRSGITSLALRGVPLSVIQKLANHSDAKMTSRYVVVDTLNLEANAMAYFQ